jgi:hypothetical protein
MLLSEYLGLKKRTDGGINVIVSSMWMFVLFLRKIQGKCRRLVGADNL